MKIQVFDPPMCCSSGVCGPSVDPELVCFAADVDWLKRQGVEVERQNLAQEPAAFANTPAVKEALGKEGTNCLPLTLADGAVVGKGRYLTREVLAGLAGLAASGSRPAAAGTKTQGCCCGSSSAPATPGSPKRSSCC
jgi:hypothetical protein